MKLYDGYLTWPGLHGTGDATVRVRAFDDVRKGETKAVVILSEPDFNKGTSVTNGVEMIAARALKDRRLWVDEVTIIEHYPARKDGAGATFDLVTFITDEQTVDRFGGLMFKGPTWYRTTADTVAKMIGSDARSVETDRF